VGVNWRKEVELQIVKRDDIKRERQARDKRHRDKDRER